MPRDPFIQAGSEQTPFVPGGASASEEPQKTDPLEGPLG